MKRKLALLLAGVMTMTMLPMNLFAASTNAITFTVGQQVAGTVLLEDTTPTTIGSQEFEEFPSDSGDVVGVKKGTDLEFTLTNGARAGEAVRLTLNNAEWFFRAGSATTAVAGVPANVAASVEATYAASPNNSVITSIFPGAAASVSALSFSAIDISGTGDTYMQTYPAMATVPTYDPAEGGYVVNASGVTGAVGLGYTGAYVRTTNGGVAEYVMGVAKGNASIADLYFTTPQTAGTKITVPMVLLVSEDDKDVSVAINAGDGSSLTSGVITIFSAGSGVTTTTADVRAGRDTLALKTITVKESKNSTLKVEAGKTYGQFTLELQDGFKFQPPAGYTGARDTKFGVALGFVGYKSTPTYTVFDTNPAGNSGSEITSLTVSVSGLTATQALRGEMYIDGLTVVSTDSDYFGDVNVTIEDQTPGLGITTQTVKVAERQQYGVSLTQTKSTDAVPTLVTGRYPSTVDNAVKLVNFKLSENTLGSWWTQRDTVITLPEGVKFRQVKVAKASNISKFDNTSLTNGAYTDDTKDIQIDGRTLTIKSTVNKTAGEKASLEFEAWVSVSQRIPDTDITLTVTGGGMDEASLPAPLVVGKTMAPITLADTTVSEIKIGLQSQPTSDIIIKETTAGALQAGKEVRIKLTDVYGSLGNNDLVFANTAKLEVTEGNIDTGSLTVGSGSVSYGSLLATSTDELTFGIDKKSSKASTIKISNVTVKASRILPETDKENYKVFVYGSAVAENYGTTGVRFKTLADAGVSTDYIRVGAGVGQLASASAKFAYSIAEGTSTYSVNGKEYPLADDMKGYNKNGTVMVPIRLIAEGFGLDVHFNESNRTVVVDLSTTVKAEFPIGKTFMRVGGTQVDMLDANDNLVATEITNDRSFVPFRQLGYALGIASANMAWDQETSTVTFNPAK